jgi:hypothetical protein
MAKSMSPSNPITSGQIAKTQELIGAALRKSGIQNDPYQQVLKTQGKALAHEWLQLAQKRVDAISGMIVRKVKVDRSRDPQQLLDATGRNQCTDKRVVAGMPRGEGEEAEVCFFKLGRFVSDDDLDTEYQLRGLEPDPYAQAQANIDDPAFADSYPNGSHWKDKDGNWCFLTFCRWDVRRDVFCRRDGDGWLSHWWFAGRRKSSTR